MNTASTCDFSLPKASLKQTMSGYSGTSFSIARRAAQLASLPRCDLRMAPAAQNETAWRSYAPQLSPEASRAEACCVQPDLIL